MHLVNILSARLSYLRRRSSANRTAILVIIAVILASSAASSQEPRHDLLGSEEALYSQGLEEVIVRDYFQDLRGGFFVDIGAGHPIEDSTTYYLEKHLGWSGIGVDALPEYAPLFQQLRPATDFHNYIVTDHSGTIESFYRVRGIEGLSSTEPDRVFRGTQLTSERIEVPTITIDDLLARVGVGRIDFLSIDIELSTLAALSAFDIERFRPLLVCAETGGPDDPDREAILEYFALHGYERVPRYREYAVPNAWFRPISGKLQPDSASPQLGRITDPQQTTPATADGLHE